MTEVRPTQKEIVDAIDRIAMTPDGHNLYVFLQRRLMKLPDPNARGALRANHGERTFASELIGLMAKGIAESVNRTAAAPAVAEPNSPLSSPPPEPVSVGRPRGAGRRIGPEDRVAGWDRTPEE
jgi:hypothetical protein